MSKTYNRGDEVTVRAVVVCEFYDGRVFVTFPEIEGPTPGETLDATLTGGSIVTHTPKPREFKPGDIVRRTTTPNVKGVLLAVDGVWAWVKVAEGYNFVCGKGELCHEDEATP